MSIFTRIKNFFNRLFGKKQVLITDDLKRGVLYQLNIVEAKLIDSLSKLTFSDFNIENELELLTELKNRLEPLKDLNQDNQKLYYYTNRAIVEPNDPKHAAKFVESKISVEQILLCLFELNKLKSLILFNDAKDCKSIFNSIADSIPKVEHKDVIVRKEDGTRKILKPEWPIGGKWDLLKEEFLANMEKTRDESDPNKFEDDMKVVLNKIIDYTEQVKKDNVIERRRDEYFYKN